MNFRMPIIGLCLIWIAPVGTAVGSTAEEIRALIGDVEIKSALLFTANRSFHTSVCSAPYKHEGYASVNSRLEYGSLSPADQEGYEAGLIAQARANNSILELARSDAQKLGMCLSVEEALDNYIIAFMEEHPHLFEKIR